MNSPCSVPVRESGYRPPFRATPYLVLTVHSDKGHTMATRTTRRASAPSGDLPRS
ncbi:hypothetical protein LU298_06695 [Komagataeibacter intermedius]|uniref:hypothetical protein n=1 Tax=Komagataeibacter intermedius TaxID=66229 RepID=UPI00390BECC0|nr:hypothetical protein [Komagataeibacter intermedius]